MKDASNLSECGQEEYTEQQKTVYVLPSCFPYVETTLDTSALEARMEREKEKNGALEVKLQEAVAAQMHLEARVQLERRVRDELAELQEENEAARDALERRLQEEIEKGSVLAANLRGNEAARLALQARMEEEKQWSGALTGRLGVQREALEAREEREKKNTMELEARMQAAEEFSQLMRQVAMDSQSRWRSELEERMEQAENCFCYCQSRWRFEANAARTAAESRVEGLEAMVQRERAERLAIQSRCSSELEERTQKAEEDAFALQLARDNKSRWRLKAAAAESRVERLEAIVQHTREELEARVQSEESLHAEILDREDALALARERLEATASEFKEQRDVLELFEEERSSLDGECCICQARPATRAMVPCGHWCVCDTCGRRAHQGRREERTCPLCRGQVDRVVRIFRSASSRTEMAVEEQARGSSAIPAQDFSRSSNGW